MRSCENGSPEGIRTLVAGLRSQSPRPLDDGAIFPFTEKFLERYSVVHLYSITAFTALGYQDSNLDLLNQNQQGCQLPHTPRFTRISPMWPCTAMAKDTSGFTTPIPR